LHYPYDTAKRRRRMWLPSRPAQRRGAVERARYQTGV